MDEDSLPAEADSSQGAEIASYDRPHLGCFAAFVLVPVAVLLLPFIVVRFGLHPFLMFVILPMLPLAWMLAVSTPRINPLEKAPAAVQWIGRILVWLLLCWFAWRGLFFIYGSVLMNAL